MSVLCVCVCVCFMLASVRYISEGRAERAWFVFCCHGRKQANTSVISSFSFGLTSSQIQAVAKMLPSPFRPHNEPFYPDSNPPTYYPDMCPYPRNVQCNPGAPYRSYDGICNNLGNPLWGSSHIPLARFLPSQYADGKK